MTIALAPALVDNLSLVLSLVSTSPRACVPVPSVSLMAFPWLTEDRGGGEVAWRRCEEEEEAVWEAVEKDCSSSTM